MEIVVHSKKPLFQQTIRRKLYHFNKNPLPRSVMSKNDPLGLPESESDKEIRHRLLVLNPSLTPPKNLQLITTPTLDPTPQSWL